VKPERVDAALAAAYQKNAADEDFLAWLNQTLAGPERASYTDRPERFPTVHVLGAPRSGTTLVVQLLASELGIGAISNLAAAFWAAPCTGLRLARKLLGGDRRSSFVSDYGRTTGLHEPHEFGYFWASHLKYRTMSEPASPATDPIDWPGLAQVLTHMTEAAGGPLVFKAFMSGFYAEQLVAVLPRTCFVLVVRDPVENALSILEMRDRYSGDRGAWTSVRPREYAWMCTLSPEEQAAGQALACEAAYRRALAKVPAANTRVVDYASLVADPRGALDDLRALVEAHGPPLSPPPARDLTLSARLPRADASGYAQMASIVAAIRTRMAEESA
jgi:hypothetical protein